MQPIAEGTLLSELNCSYSVHSSVTLSAFAVLSCQTQRLLGSFPEDPIWEDPNRISGKRRFMSNLNSSACLDSEDAKCSVLNVSDTRVLTSHYSRQGASTAGKAEPAFH